jgi:hypothetical protein
MGLAQVAERTFGFECGLDYTNKKLYKTFYALSGYYLFFPNERPVLPCANCEGQLPNPLSVSYHFL